MLLRKGSLILGCVQLLLHLPAHLGGAPMQQVITITFAASLPDCRVLLRAQWLLVRFLTQQGTRYLQSNTRWLSLQPCFVEHCCLKLQKMGPWESCSKMPLQLCAAGAVGAHCKTKFPGINRRCVPAAAM